MPRSATKPLIFTAILLAGALAAPSAQAEWRGRGDGWGHGGFSHHHYRGQSGGGVALGALLGLGAGVALGTAFAPPIFYAPPPIFYGPPPRYFYASPAPVYDGAPPYSWGGGRQMFTPHVPPAPPKFDPGFGGGFRK